MDKRKNCGVGTGVAALGGLALSSLLGTTFLCGTASPALAAADDHDTLDLSDLERVTDGSLDDLRGGFNVGGYEISFGITITTTINGQQLLQTSFNVNQPGQIENVVSNYIQQQQAAMAGGGSGGPGGPVSNNLGDIQVEVEIDEDGEIDVDIDSDLDFDADTAPEAAQALADIEAVMEGLENGGGPTGTGTAQVAMSETGSDIVSEPAADQSTLTVEVADFQRSDMAPLPPAAQAAGGGSGDEAPVDISGIETPAIVNAPSGTGTPTWITTALPDGNGMQVSSPDLATTIIQQIGNGVSTSIANSANNMNIEVATEMNVFLDNFAQMQAQAITAEVTSSIMQDMMNQAAGVY